MLPVLASPLAAQDLVIQEMRIPAPGAGSAGLAGLMVRPNEPGPHPLAVLSHGTPKPGTLRSQMMPSELLPQAEEFARRGWTAVLVLRRGYGNSGGRYAEDSHACSPHPEYYAAGVQSANDIRAAIAYLSALPEVDSTRILAVGRSAGGFATVALTARPPAGLVAAINFAGGRGKPVVGDVCNPDDQIAAYHTFGTTSRVPMLWVYAANDGLFPPDLADAFYRAFTAAGGQAEFVRADSYDGDGHRLFSPAGIPVWTPIVDAFLERRHLVLRPSPVARSGSTG